MPIYAPSEDQSTNAGTEADLETRIDQPPLPTSRGDSSGIAAKMLAQADLLAMIQVESSKARPDATFIALPCAIGLIGRTPWDTNQIRDAIGGSWTTETHGSHTIYHAGWIRAYRVCR